MIPRAFATLKGLRPRRRVKPEGILFGKTASQLSGSCVGFCENNLDEAGSFDLHQPQFCAVGQDGVVAGHGLCRGVHARQIF
jgi:hypothetical protein